MHREQDGLCGVEELSLYFYNTIKKEQTEHIFQNQRAFLYQSAYRKDHD